MNYKNNLMKTNLILNTIKVRKYSQKSLPLESKVVIYGNGLTSKSIAYHLSSKLGNNCILITGKSSRNTTQAITDINSCYINHLMVSNPRLSLLIKYTSKLYDINSCGAIYLAQNKERIKSFKRMISSSKLFNKSDENTIELLSAEELKRRYSYLNCDSIECGIYVPIDGIIDDISAQELKLQTFAENNGVKFFSDYMLKKVNINNNRVSYVELLNSETNELSKIDCEFFINSANNYKSRILGKRSVTKVRIPSLCCENQVLETKPFHLNDGNYDNKVPILHDLDSRLTAYQTSDLSFRLTGCQKVSKVVQQRIIADKSGSNIEIPEVSKNWDDFHHILDPVLNRIPSLSNAKLHKLHARLENFTPDGRPLIGEVPEVRNYLLAAAVPPQMSGAAGRLITDIIAKEYNSFGHDFWSLDPRRFTPMHSNRVFLFDRLREIPAKIRYNINYPQPHHDYETGHGLRVSPIYPRLQEKGALFSQIMGYERPAVYINDGSDSEPIDRLNIRHRILETPSFGRPHWLEAVHEEYQACRERVALLDYCSFTKLELKSPNDEVVELLQYLCSNDVDVNVGSIVHTGMQNESGGYENDVSLIRLAENKYMLIGPTEQQTRCLSWLKRHNMEPSIQITDISPLYTAICVMGPLSKLLLADVLTDAHQLDSFPFFTYKELNIGLAINVRVCNLTHTGELGWVLYIPNDFALHVYDLLVRVGEKYGLRHAGSIAMRTLRIEKFFAFWGQDLDTTTTPLECGRSFRVKFDKEFLGRNALIQQKAEGVRRRYVQLVLEDFNSNESVWPWGGEPIFMCDDRYRDIPVGLTTTTGYGFTLLRHVCLGFIRHPENEIITNDFILKSKFEVEIGGKRFKARTNIHSPQLTDVSGTYLATR